MIPIFFSAAEIAERLRGEVIGDGSIRLSGFAPADTAKAGDLTFAEKQTYFIAAEQSAAAAILISGDFGPSKKVLIRVPNARIAMARVMPLFYPSEKPVPGVHPTAIIDPTAKVDPTAHIGSNCILSAGVRVGARSVLLSGNYIGPETHIGEDACFYQNVVVYARSQIGDRVTIHAASVIGADGFGYVLDEGRHRKLLQIGNVVIHEDVEIGANTTIDRATLGSTIIGQGTKIDNLVQIAHNVVIGRHCIIMGQAGIAGSTQLGDYCIIGAQAGILGHLKFGKASMVGGKSGVTHDIPDGQAVLGYPAAPERQAKRQWAAMQRLPELARRVRDLERQLEQLRSSGSNPDL